MTDPQMLQLRALPMVIVTLLLVMVTWLEVYGTRFFVEHMHPYFLRGSFLRENL